MTEESSERYAGRGVSSTKSEVHNAIKKIDKGLYPLAFCKIIPDVLTNDPEWALVMHADGKERAKKRTQVTKGKDRIGKTHWFRSGSVGPERRGSVYRALGQRNCVWSLQELTR